jgi:hypothetical protein
MHNQSISPSPSQRRFASGAPVLRQKSAATIAELAPIDGHFLWLNAASCDLRRSIGEFPENPPIQRSRP